jgi:Xaa-Pro aminopeptidase
MAAKKVTMGEFDPATIGEVEYPFSIDEYTARLSRIRELMASKNIDLLYVTTPEAICYIHGYMTSWYKANSPRRYPQMYGTAIHVDHDRFIHFDHPTEEPVLYRTSISKDNRFFSTREGGPNLKFIMDELRKEGWLNGTVGMEFWSYIPNRAVSEMMEKAFRANGCDVVDGTGILRTARRIKSPQEIQYFEEAVKVADIGHQAIIDNLKPGITELELYGKVLAAMMAAGGEHQALVPIFIIAPVVDGVAISAGHLQATRKKIQKGEHLSADICGVINGYHGNVCRGYYVGETPERLKDQYEKAGGVFKFLQEEVHGGITVGEFCHRAKEYYEKVGLLDSEGWALGYELGLSFPPDWVGEFFFDINDELYLDRAFEVHMVTNFESFFNTTLIDTLVWEQDRVRVLSKITVDIIGVN